MTTHEESEETTIDEKLSESIMKTTIDDVSSSTSVSETRFTTSRLKMITSTKEEISSTKDDQQTEAKSSTTPISTKTTRTENIAHEDTLCKDVWIYCKYFTDFCANSFWALWMKGVCYKTCGHCTDGSCSDNLWYCQYYTWACPWSSYLRNRCQKTCKQC